MPSSLRLALGLAIPVALFAGCESEGSAPPAADLFADPEVCDVPCEVVLDSGLEPSEGKLLTFTWDLGEGPVPGDARLLHRFEEVGSYTVTVTASDGQSSTTDTTTVLVEAQPKASGTIDETGGSVSQGACTVTVPEGVAPEALTLEVTELPSMQLTAERAIGRERNRSITPFERSSVRPRAVWPAPKTAVCTSRPGISQLMYSPPAAGGSDPPMAPPNT